MFALAFALSCAVTSTFAADEAWPDVFNPFRVRTLFIEIDPATWESIKHDQNYSNCNTPGCDPALNIRAACLMWDDANTNRLLVQIRRKSDPALPDESNPQKVSLKIDVNEYVAGQDWRGLKKISLENGNGGNGVLREGMAMQLYRLAGEVGFYDYQPGYSAWVRLVVNGSYVGLYSSPEQRDKTFLEHRGMYKPGASWLYEINGGITLDTTVASTNSPTHDHLCYPPFQTACTQPDLEADLPQWIDLRTMLTMAAIEAFLANNDGLFTHNGKNSFAVDFLPSAQRRRLYFPWDLDATATSQTFNIYDGGPGNANSHVYQRQILDHYWFRQVYRHTFTDLLDGPLSTGAITDFLNRLEPILGPCLAEDPNAGDSFESVRQYFTNRVANVRAQLGAVTGGPVFNQNGGEIIPGFTLTLTHTNPTGAIYYTLDGTDPRGIGGVTNGLLYSAPITLTNTTPVTARVKSGTNWSALRQQTFNVAGHAGAIRVTEIMYRPKPPAADQPDGDYEFIELKNTGTVPVNLSECYFSGIDFVFASGAIVAPGAFVVLVRNPVAFAARYPGVPFHGVYFGGLSAKGEKIRLRNSDGNNIFSVEYSNKAPWPLGADGLGYSLVNLNPDGDPDNPENWRASTNENGSPGADDPLPPYRVGVVVNEVLAHTDSPLEDAIELYNPTSNSIDISGWYLSDENDTADATRARLKKYRIPAGTVVPAGGYKAFYESDFNPGSASSASLIKFGLSQYGEGAYLASAAPGGELTGHIVGMEFGASDNGVSFGRYQTSVGPDWTFFDRPTFGVSNPATKTEFRLGAGMTNSLPRIGPVVVSEIMYHPAAGGNEFVELQNIAGTNVDLAGWTLEGAAEFVFPSNCLIGPGGFLVVLGTTNLAVAEFRAANQVPASVPILAHAFELQNDGEELALCKPNDYPTNAPIVVDRVRYNDKSPWPTEADGEGPSLERFSATAYGNDPLNWRTLKNGGSPGLAVGFSNVVAIAKNSSWRYSALGYNLGTAWETTVYSDSGWPSGDGVLGYGQPVVNTIVTSAVAATSRPITTYFRKEFVVNDDPKAITSLVMEANYDDGLVVYLNGHEVVRRAMPGGTVFSDVLASWHEGSDAERIDLTSHRDKLVRGGNLLAVEVHQATADDPDLVWDAELTYGLTGTVPSEPTQITAVTRQPSGLLLEWSAVSGRQYRVQRTEDLSTWTDLEPVITASGPAAQYLDAEAPLSPGGLYRVVLLGN